MASTLSFYSPGGVQHTVNISKGNYVLTGTTEPFVIQMNDDDDLFTPIRETTGYINFIDNGTVWEKLIPSSATDVMVTCGNFVGFVIPQTYGGQFLYVPSEYSLAIGCPLRALSAFKLSYSMINGSTISFNNLLDLLVSFFPSSANVSISVTNDVYVNTYLKLHVQWALLFEEDDTNEAFIPKYNNLEILQHICQFFGFTATSNGSTIILTPTDYYNATPHSVTRFLLADTSSSVELLQGVGLVKVNAGVTNENPFKFAFDQILNSNIQLSPLTTYGRLYNGNGYVAYYLTQSQTSALAGVDIPQQYSFYDFNFDAGGGTFYNLSVISTDHVDYDPYNKQWNSAIRFWKLSDPSTFIMSDLSQSSVFTLRKRVFVSGGYVLIKARTYYFANDVNNYEQDSPEATIVGMFRIGSMYYNGTEFVQYSGSGEIPHFTIYSKNGALGKREWQQAYWSQISYLTDGYQIPITQNLEGEVEFAIGPVLTVGDSKPGIFIENITVDYKRDSGYRSETSKIYMSDGGDFDKDISISPIFCTDTDRMLYGPQLLVDANGYYGNKNGDDHIEQVVAGRIANFCDRTRKVLTLNIREDDTLYSLEPPYKVSYNNGQYQCICVSRNPAQGIATIKLVKL